MFPSSALLAPLLVFLLASTGTSAQSATSNAETALTVLQRWYNETTGIWDTCGWWNAANCMTVLADLAAFDSSVLDTASYVFNNTYVVAPAVNPAPGIKKVDIAGMPYTYYDPSWPSWSPEYLPEDVGTVNASAWLDGYYDDDSWWALAWIAAYDVTENEDYLNLAISIFEDLVSVRWHMWEAE